MKHTRRSRVCVCAACIELLQIPALFVVHLRTLSVFYMIDLNCYLSQHALLFKNTTVLPESFDNVNAKLLVVVAAAATEVAVYNSAVSSQEIYTVVQSCT